MKNAILYCTIILSFLTSSCQELFFKGKEETRNITLGNFHKVIFTGIYDIVLVQDSLNRLVITGKNNINSIDAVIINDTLIINDHKKMSLNPGRNNLELHFTSLDQMITYDPVNVSNKDTIRADFFQYDALGEISETNLVINCNYLIVYTSFNSLGYLYLKGRADFCDLSARYGCSIFAGDLHCLNGEILNESVGDIYANVSGNIKAHLRGTGNIYCYGNPVIDIADQRGSGKIITITP
jgi:hypothetical protein